MTIEERLAAVERELAHQNEMRGLREINEKLAASRAERIEGQLTETKKVLPDLQAAMKELEEAAVVTSHVQHLQASMLKDHVEWLHSHDLAMLAHSEAAARHDREMTEIRENGRALDERIEKLVSAIGELISRNGK